ncbi:hypothetical protein ACJX0J_017875, partial [Zea mays]
WYTDRARETEDGGKGGDHGELLAAGSRSDAVQTYRVYLSEEYFRWLGVCIVILVWMICDIFGAFMDKLLYLAYNRIEHEAVCIDLETILIEIHM